MPKKILVLGATGPTGLLILKKALDHGHEVTAYVRSPSKIPSELTSNPNLTVRRSPPPAPRTTANPSQIVQGTLSDDALLASTVAGHAAIISALGPNTVSPSPRAVADAYRALFAAMHAHGVRRILALATTSVRDPGDRFALTAAGPVFAVWAFAHAAWRSFVEVAAAFDEGADGLDWTLFRVGGLGDGAEGDVVATYIGGDGYRSVVNRADIAKWVVEQVEMDEPQWVGKRPLLCSRTASLLSWRPGFKSLLLQNAKS
jgi:nucleoside-diphosphate-sugar epimerase